MGLVSGVITTHNRTSDIVERALKSILNQTHTDVEVIIVDDSSPDFEGRADVEAMALSYAEKRVKYIKNEVNLGACASRNLGLYEAKGEIIGFLDDDDEWLPEKVEKMLPLFENEKVGLVYCSWRMKNDITGKTVDKILSFPVENVYDLLLRNNNYIGSTSFPLLRRSHLIKIGGFDPVQPAAQDLDVWLRMAQVYEVAFVDEPLVLYHVHAGDQITKSLSKRIVGWERIIKKHEEYLIAHPDIYYYRLQKLSATCGKEGLIGKAFDLWLKCVGLKFCYVKKNSSLLFTLIKYTVKKASRK